MTLPVCENMEVGGQFDLQAPNDRHVLAAVMHSRASTIMTDILKDLPASELFKHVIEPKSADDFITNEIDLDIINAVV